MLDRTAAGDTGDTSCCTPILGGATRPRCWCGRRRKLSAVSTCSSTTRDPSSPRCPFLEIDDAFVDSVFDLNVRAVIDAVQARRDSPPGKTRRARRSSMSARSPVWIGGGPGTGMYGSTKAFMHNLTRHLARDLAPRRIRVNTVSPRGLSPRRFTPPHRRAHGSHAQVGVARPRWHSRRRGRRIPLSRLAGAQRLHHGAEHSRQRWTGDAMSYLTTRIAGACLLLAVCAGSAAGTRVDLNADWRFRVDGPDIGLEAGVPREIPANTELVSLPHSWNRPGRTTTISASPGISAASSCPNYRPTPPCSCTSARPSTRPMSGSTASRWARTKAVTANTPSTSRGSCATRTCSRCASTIGRP